MMAKEKRKGGPGRPPSGKPRKKQWPLRLDEDVRERLARAAFWTRRTANGIIEEGLLLTLAKLEAKNGGPFPPVKEE